MRIAGVIMAEIIVMSGFAYTSGLLVTTGTRTMSR
jgi:hypothetical protein